MDYLNDADSMCASKVTWFLLGFSSQATDLLGLKLVICTCRGGGVSGLSWCWSTPICNRQQKRLKTAHWEKYTNTRLGKTNVQISRSLKEEATCSSGTVKIDLPKGDTQMVSNSHGGTFDTKQMSHRSCRLDCSSFYVQDFVCYIFNILFLISPHLQTWQCSSIIIIIVVTAVFVDNCWHNLSTWKAQTTPKEDFGLFRLTCRI